MTAHPLIAGYCPMGCGQTLFLGDGGFITCSWQGCPNRGAVTDLLAADSGITEHIVQIDADDWTMRHPLRERVEGTLFGCPTAGAFFDQYEETATLMRPGQYSVRDDGTLAGPIPDYWSDLTGGVVKSGREATTDVSQQGRDESRERSEAELLTPDAAATPPFINRPAMRASAQTYSELAAMIHRRDNREHDHLAAQLLSIAAALYEVAR
ncbi:hypothetical protein GRS96_12490 [Rathayibacter sp. VKM Ac-2803]|uniref:DUF6085 family protein n=1 Tax=Rathayibacter sp. VKM Ac-2803 TaxID=2609256 RepID=UPI00135AAD59|nr:DUF6085 family protein [Rathayibacter sp. VKM Ac-2803]MWV50087.1 hypothetical protein [Rathayibacter sp. VKM Ac-2803]